MPVTFSRYVALGDSQTEGLLDPDGRGGHRGWADRFAEHVTAGGSPALQYANLAVRGRLIGEIHDQQLTVAQAMQPDLVTVMGGLNDVLRPSSDVDAMLVHLDALVGGFPGATVLTNTFPDLGAVVPVARRLVPKVEAYNAGIREVASARGAVLVDFDGRGVQTDPRIWSADRIHANPRGHALIAAAFADALGLDGFGSWRDPLPPVARGAVATAAAEARWVGAFVLPWLWRRARGVSSGDGVTAKRPRLLPVAPLYHLIDPAAWSGAVHPGPEPFVHLSFAHQVAGSADRHLADAPALVALEVDATRTGADVVVEDSYGSGTAFPHLYGTLPGRSVTRVVPLTRGPDGRWRFSAAGAAAPASPDR